ncbi:MAG TPA: NAD(+)/NADH kinase [Dehalococcoidales bacterium]|nr:NAD(+)/NADH kinase [Dehalococcoidales bacterium]
MQIKKIGILFHPMLETTRLKAVELTAFLEAQNVESWTCSAWDKDRATEYLNNTDLIITTGGDGTILRAAHVVYKQAIPITGVNMGTLGFLTEIKADEAIGQIKRILAGEGWLDERSMLEAQLFNPEGEPYLPDPLIALNDVVLARGAVAKLIQIAASVDEKPLTNYRADGIILATATGSTGYALSAGGPIVYPHSENFLLVPIVPHLTLGYSLVLSSESTVKLQLRTSTQATLSIDGHINIPVVDKTVFRIRRSKFKNRFLRLRPAEYFFTELEEKLRGKK